MKTISSARKWWTLAGFIAAAFVAGAIGSSATFPNVNTWYPTLHKPVWNPPNAIFAPMWTTLYVLMGIAIWRAWRVDNTLGRAAVKIYFVQLVLNALWSVLFFGLKQPAGALADIVLLWITLVWMQRALFRTDQAAGLLWLPYSLWVSFAMALNFSIVRLN